MIEELFKKARKDLFYPPIWFEVEDVPNSYLDFSSRKYKVVVSRRQIEKLSNDAIVGLFHHELNHWVKHPYDAKTIILELHWLGDRPNKKMIRNLFDDIVVNLDLVINKGLDEVSYVYREIRPVTKIDHLMRALLHKLTGLDFGEYRLDSNLKKKLEELLEIDFLDTNRIRLKNNIRRFADIIEDILDEQTVTFIIFDLEDFSKEDISRALREIAKEVDREEYIRIVKELLRDIEIEKGAETKTVGMAEEIRKEFQDPEIEWYKARAMNYTIHIKPLKRTGSLYPSEIKDFEIEDGIDSYNPIESYGKLIPGLAKKYSLEDFEGFDEKAVPDAVIIIDSSGSMRNPDRKVSYAVLGAFAIARSYLESGAKVGVINFSNRNIELLPTKGDEVYKVIKIYQGGGTVLHVDQLEEYVKKVGNADYILITDAGLYNITEVIEFFARLKYRLTLIWIKSDVKNLEEFRRNFEMFKKLRNINIVEVESEEDIPRIAITSVADRFS